MADFPCYDTSLSHGSVLPFFGLSEKSASLSRVLRSAPGKKDVIYTTVTLKN